MDESVADRFKRLFSPESAPGRRVGIIGNVEATGPEIAAAAEAWSARQRLYPWAVSTREVFAEAAGLGVAEAPAGPVARKPLPFWPGAWLWHFGALEASRTVRAADRRVTVRPQPDLAAVHTLLGQSPVIHKINGTILQKSFGPGGYCLQEYLTFFCEHVHAELGGFHIVETATVDPGALPLAVAARDVRPGTALTDFESQHASLVQRSRHLPPEHAGPVTLGHPMIVLPPRPLRSVRPDAEDGEAEIWPVIATVLYGVYAFRSLFAVPPDGTPLMIEDEMIADTSIDMLAAGWAGPAERATA